MRYAVEFTSNLLLFLISVFVPQKARLQGQFNTLKGRGQPIKQLTEEKNPFIAREEFLMNRIVQRNGAVPPWVDIQGGPPNVS